jgi:hypothetical protein
LYIDRSVFVSNNLKSSGNLLIDFLSSTSLETVDALLISKEYEQFGQKYIFNYIKSLDIDKKNDGIFSYKYYFMAENNSEHNYITEKLWEPIICECLCFYWGAPNVSDYIDKRAYISLDLDNLEESYNIISKYFEERLSKRGGYEEFLQEKGYVVKQSRIYRGLDKT